MSKVDSWWELLYLSVNSYVDIKSDWHYYFVKVDVLVAQLVLLFVTLGAVACQAPRSMVFPRQKYWSGLPFPSPGGLPSWPGIEPSSPALQADSLLAEPPGKPLIIVYIKQINAGKNLKCILITNFKKLQKKRKYLNCIC